MSMADDPHQVPGRHKSWCLHLEPHEPEQGCEGDVGSIDTPDLFVAVGILDGRANVSIEMRHPEGTVDLSNEDLAKLADLFGRALKMVTGPDGASLCVLCGAIALDGEVQHAPDCRLAGAA